MNRRGEWLDNRCPRCGEHQENKQHVVLCPEKTAKANFIEAVDAFASLLHHERTHPLITDIFTKYLSLRGQTTMAACVGDYSYTIDECDYVSIKEAAACQDILGWNLFLEGKLVKAWTKIQARFFRSLRHCNKKGVTWSAHVIQGLYGVIHSQWVHRNKFLHNNDDENYVTKETKKLNKDVEDDFRNGIRGLRTCDMDLMDADKEDVLALTNPRKRLWIKILTTAREQAISTSDTAHTTFYSAEEQWQYEQRKKKLKKKR